MTENTAPLKLRDDAYWSASSTEITVITHRGPSTIPAPMADRWMDRLVPHLTGHHTMDDFVRSLDGDRQAFVRGLLRTLVDRGLLSEVGPGETADSPNPETNLLGYFRRSPSAAYDAWHDTEMVIIGDSFLGAHVAAACTRSGVRSVVTADADAAVQAPQKRPGGGQVVHIGARHDIALLTRVERWCDDHDIPLTQIVLDGEVVWIAWGTGFTNAHHRLPRMAFPPRHVSQAAKIVLANHVVHTLMRARAADRGARRENRLTRFVWESLHTSSHRYIPVPGGGVAPAPPSEDLGRRVAALMAADPSTPEAFSRKAATLTGDHLGVFDKISEGDLAQLPLRVSHTTYSVPRQNVADGPLRLGVWGVGVDPVQARHAAAFEAIRGYSSLFVDENRLTHPDGHPAAHGGARRPALGEPMVRCFDLLNSTTVLIPVSEVYPGPGDAPSYRPPVGVAAGLGLERAIVAGLIDLCRQGTVAGLAVRESPCPLVEIERFTDDPVTGYCSTMLAAGHADIEIYDVTSDRLAVPAVAVVIDGSTAAYGCGLDMAAAVSDGMLPATAAWQSRVSGRPEFAPSEVYDLPNRLRDGIATTDGRGAALTRRDLEEALSNGGHSLCVALLDHDPVVFGVLPVVRVLVR